MIYEPAIGSVSATGCGCISFNGQLLTVCDQHVPPPPDRIAELGKRTEILANGYHDQNDRIAELEKHVAVLADQIKACHLVHNDHCEHAASEPPTRCLLDIYHDGLCKPAPQPERGETIKLHRLTDSLIWTECGGAKCELTHWQHRTARFDAPASVAAAEEKHFCPHGRVERPGDYCIMCNLCYPSDPPKRDDGPGDSIREINGPYNIAPEPPAPTTPKAKP